MLLLASPRDLFDVDEVLERLSNVVARFKNTLLAVGTSLVLAITRVLFCEISAHDDGVGLYCLVNGVWFQYLGFGFGFRSVVVFGFDDAPS